MSQEFNAIYEGGVFRPLTPLNLPESTPVTVVVQEPNDRTPCEAAELKHQQRALDAMFSVVDKLPQTPNDDGLSGRDHDQILYGTPKDS
jgi:predicted DNA-binding antitoxin AbrB/MazE fold protein